MTTFVFESPELEGRPDPWGLRAPTGQAYMLYSDMLPLDRDGNPKPTFTTSEVAKVFFGMSTAWLAQKEGRTNSKGPRRNHFVLDGHLIVIKRSPSGFRQYTLVDIERMAHALAQAGSIGGERLISILTVVRHVAILNGVPL